MIQRLVDGFEIAYPAPSTATAGGVTAAWWLTGQHWPVAVLGFVLVVVVRLSLNRARWGEHSARADEVREKWSEQ
jgi:hypothetical protein